MKIKEETIIKTKNTAEVDKAVAEYCRKEYGILREDDEKISMLSKMHWFEWFTGFLVITLIAGIVIDLFPRSGTFWDLVVMAFFACLVFSALNRDRIYILKNCNKNNHE